MKLISYETIIDIINPPAPEELEKWTVENRIMMTPFAEEMAAANKAERGPGDMLGQSHLTAAAFWHAATRYPESNTLDQASFAGLVAGLATGLYGGFGTDQYEKENQASDIITALAGGMPAAPDEIVGTIPRGIENRPDMVEFTKKAFAFLEKFYFVDQEQAVMELIEDLDQNATARVLLSLARTKDSYAELAFTVREFLARREPISSLRKAVKKATDLAAE
jgi:hypothetical protein